MPPALFYTESEALLHRGDRKRSATATNASHTACGALNYDEAPRLAIWKVTESCDLACKHCRAAAQPIAHPDQLSTAEGKAIDGQK
jgi:hypothetical protein